MGGLRAPVKIHLANHGHGNAAALAKQIESSLRQCAHERLIVEQKAAVLRTRHNLRPAPPVDLATVDNTTARPLLVAPVRCAAGRVRRLRVRGAASRSRAARGVVTTLDWLRHSDAMSNDQPSPYSTAAVEATVDHLRQRIRELEADLSTVRGERNDLRNLNESLRVCAESSTGIAERYTAIQGTPRCGPRGGGGVRRRHARALPGMRWSRYQLGLVGL